MYVTTKNIGLHNPKIVCDFHLVKAADRAIRQAKLKVSAAEPQKPRGTVFRDSLHKMHTTTNTAKSGKTATLGIDNENNTNTFPCIQEPQSSNKPDTTLGQQDTITDNEKLHRKYLVIGALEVGDSFGFGEDLSNIFLISATETECLVVPGHIMMTAERHIEILDRESIKDNKVENKNSSHCHTPRESTTFDRHSLHVNENDDMGGLTSTHDIISAATMRTNNRRKSVIGGEVRRPIITTHRDNSAKQESHSQKNRDSTHSNRSRSSQHHSSDQPNCNNSSNNKRRQSRKHHGNHDKGMGAAHHYDELRSLIESKIMSEEDCFKRWRQGIDWQNYKSEILSEIIERKNH